MASAQITIDIDIDIDDTNMTAGGMAGTFRPRRSRLRTRAMLCRVTSIDD